MRVQVCQDNKVAEELLQIAASLHQSHRIWPVQQLVVEKPISLERVQQLKQEHGVDVVSPFELVSFDEMDDAVVKCLHKLFGSWLLTGSDEDGTTLLKVCSHPVRLCHAFDGVIVCRLLSCIQSCDSLLLFCIECLGLWAPQHQPQRQRA